MLIRALDRALEFGAQLEHPGRLGAGQIRAVGHAIDLGGEVGLLGGGQGAVGGSTPECGFYSHAPAAVEPAERIVQVSRIRSRQASP